MEKLVSYGEAINKTLIDLMEWQKDIYILGQGANDPTSAAGPLQGIKDKFPDRIQDVPMAEEAVAGICIGMAMNGLKTINWHIRMDFLLLAMNQIINMASKVRYMYGGNFHCPVSFRSMIGKSWGQGPQHSQSFYPQFMNIPGLNVYAPSIPHDASIAYAKMILSGEPSIMIEHRLLYYQKGPVGDWNTNELVLTRTLRTGRHVTLVGVSQMAIECLRAAKLLAEVGIDAEVITPVSIKPLDIQPIRESVEFTGNLITVDNSWIQGGLGGEIISRLHEENTRNFRSARMGFAETVCPTSPTIEKLFYPNPVSIAYKVCEILDYNKFDFDLSQIKMEETEFKGPF